MTLKKKFKRFRKEWYYTGILAFFTTCIIALIICTACIISSAEELSDNSDIIYVSKIEEFLSDQDIDYSKYFNYFGNGFTSVNESFLNFDYSELNKGSATSGDMYVRLVDSDFEVTEYHAVFNIIIDDYNMLNGLPYVVQYNSNSDEYRITYFCTVDYDSDYVWQGNLLPVECRIVRGIVFCQPNSLAITYYLDENLEFDGVGFSSLTYDNSGYSTTWDHNGTYYNLVGFPISEGLSTVLSNISYIGLANNKTSYPVNAYRYFDSATREAFINIGIEPDGDNLVYMHPINNSSDDSGSAGTDDNNLVLENGDWHFQSSNYSAPYSNVIDTGSIYPKGSATFISDLTDYQLEHLSNFEVVYSFTFDLDVDYQNWGTNDIGYFKQTSKLLNNKKNFKAQFHFDFNDDPDLVQNLSAFHSSGNSKSFTFQRLFENLHGTSGNLSNLLLQMKELDSVSYNKFDLYCTAWIDSQNTVNSSGKITEWYNPMNKKGYTTDDSGKTNPNPYIPSPEEQGNEDVKPKPNTPGPGGNDPGNTDPGNTDVTSSGNGSVNVTVQNNPTFNNNVNSSSTSSGSGTDFSNPENAGVVNFYNTFNPFTLLFGKLTGDNRVDTEKVSEVTGVNPFLEIMSQTFSFVPVGFWSTLLGFFVACVSIFIVAFIIRIILDLL